MTTGSRAWPRLAPALSCTCTWWVGTAGWTPGGFVVACPAQHARALIDLSLQVPQACYAHGLPITCINTAAVRASLLRTPAGCPPATTCFTALLLPLVAGTLDYMPRTSSLCNYRASTPRACPPTWSAITCFPTSGATLRQVEGSLWLTGASFPAVSKQQHRPSVPTPPTASPVPWPLELLFISQLPLLAAGAPECGEREHTYRV